MENNAISQASFSKVERVGLGVVLRKFAFTLQAFDNRVVLAFYVLTTFDKYFGITKRRLLERRDSFWKVVKRERFLRRSKRFGRDILYLASYLVIYRRELLFRFRLNKLKPTRCSVKLRLAFGNRCHALNLGFESLYKFSRCRWFTCFSNLTCYA